LKTRPLGFSLLRSLHLPSSPSTWRSLSDDGMPDIAI
jgi:hypothetical protein